MEKTYIGDGCYFEMRGEDIVLTTNDGRCDTNTIVLEPEVFATFLIRVTHLKTKKIEAARQDAVARGETKPCTTCGATGTVVDNLDGPNHPNTVDCETCGGSGRVSL